MQTRYNQANRGLSHQLCQLDSNWTAAIGFNSVNCFIRKILWGAVSANELSDEINRGLQGQSEGNNVDFKRYAADSLVSG